MRYPERDKPGESAVVNNVNKLADKKPLWEVEAITAVDPYDPMPERKESAPEFVMGGYNDLLERLKK